MAELIVRRGTEEFKRINLPDGSVLDIGSLPENEVFLDEEIVSRHHARFEARAGRYFLTDLNSTNGTRLNGNEIDEEEVAIGDAIAIGPYSLEVVEDGGRGLSRKQKETKVDGMEPKQPSGDGKKPQKATEGPKRLIDTAQLRVIKGPKEVEDLHSIDLDRTGYIGRDKRNEYRVPDPSVSGEHAQILVGPGRFGRGQIVTIADRQSRHGTKINGRHNFGHPCRLARGDRVQLGDSLFEFTPAGTGTISVRVIAGWIAWCALAVTVVIAMYFVFSYRQMGDSLRFVETQVTDATMAYDNQDYGIGLTLAEDAIDRAGSVPTRWQPRFWDLKEDAQDVSLACTEMLAAEEAAARASWNGAIAHLNRVPGALRSPVWSELRTYYMEHPPPTEIWKITLDEVTGFLRAPANRSALVGELTPRQREVSMVLQAAKVAGETTYQESADALLSQLDERIRQLRAGERERENQIERERQEEQAQVDFPTEVESAWSEFNLARVEMLLAQARDEVGGGLPGNLDWYGDALVYAMSALEAEASGDRESACVWWSRLAQYDSGNARALRGMDDSCCSNDEARELFQMARTLSMAVPPNMTLDEHLTAVYGYCEDAMSVCCPDAEGSRLIEQIQVWMPMP